MAEIPVITQLKKESFFLKGMNSLAELDEEQLKKSFDLVIGQDYEFYYFTEAKIKEFAKILGITDEEIAGEICGGTVFLLTIVFIEEYSVDDVIENLAPILETEEKINKLTNVLHSVVVPEVKDKVRSMHIAQEEISMHVPNVEECSIYYTLDKRAIFVDDKIQKFIPIITVSFKHKEKSFTFQSTIEAFDELISIFKNMLSLAQKLRE